MSRKLSMIAVIIAFALIAASCGSSSDNETTTTAAGGETGGLSGSITVSGSSTVEPITARVGEDFHNANPGVAVSVEGPGTGDGFKKFCAGETDISDASRQIKDSEAEACAASGIEWIELVVAWDGISVLTSPENDIHACLTFDDIYALTGPESTGFGKWSDASGLANELGNATTAAYVDENLSITAPGEESGTYDTFASLAIKPGSKARDTDDVMRPDYTASANDNVIIEGIAGSKYSLGYVGYSFYANNTDKVKALEVNDGEGGCVAPSEETIKSGEYPLSRLLYIYVNATRVDENPALGAFVDYYLSDDGLSNVTKANYIELADYQPTLDAWANKTADPQG
ncbi:MAG: phosphate ABC transporter substrate-binding protein PstS family protein [Actinomycetota bacterium]